MAKNTLTRNIYSKHTGIPCCCYIAYYYYFKSQGAQKAWLLLIIIIIIIAWVSVHVWEAKGVGQARVVGYKIIIVIIILLYQFSIMKYQNNNIIIMHPILT